MTLADLLPSIVVLLKRPKRKQPDEKTAQVAVGVGAVCACAIGAVCEICEHAPEIQAELDLLLTGTN